MNIHSLHSWDLTPAEAVALQRTLRSLLHIEGTLKPESIRYVGGVDVSMSKEDPTLTAGIVVLDAKTMSVVETASARIDPPMPYIPGLLSFREIPALVEALKHIEHVPDVILVDGQGIAHPRRLGIAAHLGLLLDVPTVGVAKNKLCGEGAMPSARAGNWSPLVHQNETIGAILRTKDNVAPVYVSPGNRIDLESAVRIVLHFTRGYRLPEPTRQAHLYVNEVRRAVGHMSI